MRLVLSSAVLALLVAETPSSVVEAFSLKMQPRFNSRPRFSGLSGLSGPSTLHMSTIERPMTAPNSPNSAGHPFGAYGKPPRDENNDDSAYSYGPKTPGRVDKSVANNNADSFESYMQRRNSGQAPPSPSSPSDNYFARQNSNFGAPSTPTTNSNANNNFGTPSMPSTPTGNSDSFSSYATRGNASTPPPATNNFGAPSSPQTPPAAPTAGSNNNSFSSFATRGNPSTPPQTTTGNNFGAPQASAAPSSPAPNNNNSFANFATGGNTSTQPAPPAPGSFEAYMNSQRSDNTSSNGRIASTVAAAADPNSPLPPYMSPASLENDNMKSANVPGSPPPNNNGRPNFQPPMPGMATQQSTSTAAAQTTFREQDRSMQNQIAPAISAPLALSGPQMDIGNPSQELVGRLDQVLNKQREFEVRLDQVDEKIDRTTQENIERTKSMLNDFREDNKKTQETFLNRINSEVHGMQSTMNKVLEEQRALKQKQENQTANFANLEKARSEQAEKLLTLEKTTSIRAQNLERNASQEAMNQKQRLEALEHNALAGGQQSGGSSTFHLEQQQNERMAAFEQSQLERMAAFEDNQRQQLEDALREHREASQQHQNTNNMNGQNNNANAMNNPEYQQERARMDETERQLQERLEQAQSRKEELLQQLREMQEQEEMHNGRGSHEDPHSARGGPSAPPPPPPYANPLDQRQQFQQQQSPPGSPSQFNRDNNPPRFEEEEEEEEQPRRRMMRDRLGKAGDEELYQSSGAGRRRAAPRDDFDDEDDFDNRMDDRMMNMDPEEERRMQHERMMRRDPASPPQAMGPSSQHGRNRQSPGSPAGRYDPRRGGPSNDMMEDELAYGISEDGVHKTLSNMRSFKGDEQLPNKSLFDDSGGMGPMGMGRRGSQREGRRAPANQADRDMRRQPQQQQRSGPGPKQRRAGLSKSPPPNPMVDKKIEHFLKETLKGGPKPHFDKELESLLMIKYSPLFSWLKPGNVSFMRNVMVTYLTHKGCQVEMDVNSASPKAAREWEELLNMLSFELQQRTGEEPRIMEEPNNQWGFYGSKNMKMRISDDGAQQERQRSRGGGVTREEAARRKRRNDKAFIVSTDPTDPTTRLL